MPQVDEIITSLHRLSKNLWWAWQPDVWDVFDRIDGSLWQQTNQNPSAFLRSISTEVLARRIREDALGSRILFAEKRLEDYLRDKGPGGNMEVGTLHAAPVAYFCAEFGVHESLPIYSGGLGVLAGDHMKASSDLGIPIVGVGLFYMKGYFHQEIDDRGWQQEVYDRTDSDDLPIEKVVTSEGRPLEIEVDLGDTLLKAHVWRAAVGSNTLLLLDADVAANRPEDRELTHVLYYGDRRIRIRQEYLLGVGGARALTALGIRPGVIHLNEGHSAFAPLEFCHQEMEDSGVDFAEARLKIARKTVFTTHTPVPAGHDRFAPSLLEETTSPLRQRLGLDHRSFHGLGRLHLDDPNETFCMTVLALKMSDRHNGVSNLHGAVSRRMWHGLWSGVPRHAVPIGHITNGVHMPSFLAPAVRALYDKILQPGWQSRIDNPETWRGLAELEPGEYWATHQALKVRLFEFVRQRVATQVAPRGDGPGEISVGSGLDPEVLTIGFARRFATYKRATLLLRDRDRFRRLVMDADRPIQWVIAGKAHPADEGGKRLIQEIIELSTDPAFGGRVVFLANYDMQIGRRLVQGVDLWLNNPRRPQEACGTSGQKAVLNGVLNFATLDGWWAEAYDGRNGFAIGSGREFVDTGEHDAYDSDALYEALEGEVIPLYYDDRHAGIPTGWTERMIWAVTSLGWRFNADRMVNDYLRSSYLPAAGATLSS
jgi:glycogen phosphorylase